MHKNNIRLVYVLTFLSECYWPSVAALFFYLRYFSFAQIATLWAIQMAASNLLEIPTGAFADIVGRKTSIVLSFMVGAVSLFIFPFTTAFGIFVILEILKGASNALYSGSMEALVYDSLKEQKRENEYPIVSAHLETINWAAWAISAIGGGYLYSLHFRSPWIIQGTMFLLAAILATRLIEPQLDSIMVTIRGALRQNIQGLRELFYSSSTTVMTLRLAVIGAGYFIAANILGASQAREYGMDATGTGWLFGIGCIFSVLASRIYPYLRGKLGERKLVIITATIMVLSFLIARYVGLWIGCGLIVMRIASSSTFRNTRSVIVNKWISSKNRATTLSSLNLLTQMPYIFLAPLFGMMIDKSSPNIFAWWMGIGILSLLGMVWLVQTRKTRKDRMRI
ncbi:MAG: major facilitator superfamily MFS_1 [uncultured bacterium]|nr:MAG: major facilitator superfamily MFS_1 [uncultured bacterium]KKU15579.1 MAG: Major facilitator superfamily [Microgenomates group bacterium GW2011_GWC2_45_8]KKU26080.1 MAG: Major facilitator superfamily [Microgenomates group bacterium GW2011_GWA2_46_16]